MIKDVYKKKSNSLEKFAVTVRTIKHNDFCFIFPFLMNVDLTRHLTRMDYPKEIAFVSIYQKLPTGILEVKKLEKCFQAKQTLFFTANNPDLIRISQNLLIEAMCDYTTDNR